MEAGMKGGEPQVVLVVEDDPSSLSYYQHILEAEGHIVLCARSLAQAAVLLRQAEVALAVVDYRLPDGAGSEVVRAVREAYPDAQAIVVTGYGNSETLAKSIDEGIFSFLNKPVDRQTFLGYARRALSMHELKRENAHLQQNVRKYAEELALRNLELEAISRITALVSAAPGLGDGHEGDALDVVRETMGADAALIFGLTGENGEFVLRNHRGLAGPEEATLARLDAFLGLVGRVATRRRIVAAENAVTLPLGYAPQSQAPVEAPDLKVVLGSPLASKGRLLGVLLAAYRVPRPLGQSNRILMASLGRQISIALENVLLGEMVAVDAVTALYNRRYFDRRFGEELSRAGRHGRCVALCLSDVDGFHAPDHAPGGGHGPVSGDRVLQGVSGCLRVLLRRSDIAARYDNGSMAIVLPETGVEGARRVAEKFRRSVERLRIQPEGPEAEEAGGKGAQVTVSVGLSCFPEPGENPESILRQADEALSRARAAGSNRVVCFGE